MILRRWEVVDTCRGVPTQVISRHFTRWGAEVSAGIMIALSKHDPLFSIKVRERR